ncbi:MAG: LysM peptidoglycan-binding domain-containing protein, partial [Candidatus Rokubacteria bacterium]|nr:LysM peptidoglycan-binding domain-containing protein [Candidatus Rokubacteria bacterium]
AAYNAGEVKVAQAIQRSGSRDFWRLTQTRHLLEETKRFVPAIVAATLIAKEPDRYGFRVSYQKPEPVDVVTVPVSLALRTIAQWTGVAVETLHALNPELRRGVTPPTGPYAVKLPPGSRERVEERMALFRPGAEESFTVHRVHQGQNLAQVARLYRTTPQELQALNGLTGGTLRAGTEVIVPALASAPSSQASKHSTQARAVSATVVRSAPSIYTVRPGDTLGGIALRHQLSPSEIARWNGLADNAIIYPGDSLRLTPEAQSGS